MSAHRPTTITTSTPPLPELLTNWSNVRDRLYDLRTSVDQTDSAAQEVQHCLTELVDIGDDIVGVLVPDVDARLRQTAQHPPQHELPKQSEHLVAVTLHAAGPPDQLTDALKLHAIRLEPPWNGFVVPVTTAAEFRRYVTAWQDTTHVPPRLVDEVFSRGDGVVEADGVLTYRSTDDDRCGDRWTTIGLHHSTPVYALDGWQWWICP